MLELELLTKTFESGNFVEWICVVNEMDMYMDMDGLRQLCMIYHITLSGPSNLGTENWEWEWTRGNRKEGTKKRVFINPRVVTYR